MWSWYRVGFLEWDCKLALHASSQLKKENALAEKKIQIGGITTLQKKNGQLFIEGHMYTCVSKYLKVCFVC